MGAAPGSNEEGNVTLPVFDGVRSHLLALRASGPAFAGLWAPGGTRLGASLGAAAAIDAAEIKSQPTRPLATVMIGRLTRPHEHRYR
jgi:hypothetical protein